MIAYNRTYLDNIALLQKAKYWFAQKLLSQEQYKAITEKYVSKFYTPALFVKIGLFIFTYVLISAAISMYSILFVMMLDGGSEGFMGFTSLLFAAGCFFILEHLIKTKNIFRSGIDEALLYAGIGFTYGFLAFLFMDLTFRSEDMFLFYSILSIPLLGAAVARYADRLITLLLAICVYVTFFLLVMKIGELAKMIMPFALMLLSAIIYFIVKKPTPSSIAQSPSQWEGRGGPYASCFVVFECVALIVFYLACNYFVIRESSIEFFDLELAEGEDIPLAFLFYILTALVPISYVYFGLKRKDKTLLWVGLLLVAVAALTFKHYFSLGHPEVTLTLAGSIMIIIAYFSIKYLKTPKHGITYEEETDEDNFLKTNAEALVIAQSFSQQSQPQNNPKFGEGGFGGGGAGSKF